MFRAIILTFASFQTSTNSASGHILAENFAHQLRVVKKINTPYNYYYYQQTNLLMMWKKNLVTKNHVTTRKKIQKA